MKRHRYLPALLALFVGLSAWQVWEWIRGKWPHPHYRTYVATPVGGD